jgi:hypothetical protein
MVITQVSPAYQLQQVVAVVLGALTHQVQVDQVVVLDKQAVEPTQVELEPLVKVITVDPMEASTFLTIQVVVEVAQVQLVEMPQAAVLQVLVEQVELGLTELPTQVVVEAVITSMLLVVLAVAVVVAKVDSAPLKVEPQQELPIPVVEAVVMVEPDLQVVVALLLSVIQVAQLAQAEQ